MTLYRASRITLALSAYLTCGLALAASPGPKVHVYNWHGYIGENTISDFQRDSGIQTKYDTYESSEVMESKLLAGRSGYDVVVAGNYALPLLIKAGALRKLDQSQLPNLSHLDPQILKKLQANDPGNQYAIPYLWGTDGLGYNVDKVKAALGDDAPVNSWDLLFKEENLAKLSQCGVAVIDAPAEVIPIALHYLGLPPNSSNPQDYQKAEALLLKLRPHITYIHSGKIGSDLANGNICLALGWGGTMLGAQVTAKEAGKNIHIKYSIPSEGAPLWIDNLVQVKDSENPIQGLNFINYMLRPEVIVSATELAQTANANKDATALLNTELRNTENLYPSAEVIDKLFILEPLPQKMERIRTRSWSKVKNGQ